MDETKFIEKIGPFGIIGLFFCVFLSITACVCLTVHVRYIYTYLFPLKVKVQEEVSLRIADWTLNFCFASSALFSL